MRLVFYGDGRLWVPHLGPELLFFILVSVMPSAMVYRCQTVQHLGTGQIQIIFGCLLLSVSWVVDYSLHSLAAGAPEQGVAFVPHLLLVLFGYVPGVCLLGFGFVVSTREIARLKHEIERRTAAESALETMNAKLEKAAQKADRANKAKSDFLANMSHELRTPLNAIMGFSELMHAETFGKLGADRYKEYLAAINSSSKQLHDNISDILDFTKASKGHMRLNREHVNLRNLCNECVAMSRAAADTKNVGLDATFAAEMTVVADRRMLMQVILNLLSNAIKFTPEYGKVSLVVLQQTDGRPVMIVRDTGVGMTEADIALATSPFEEAESLVARSHESVALQLALVNKFVELHDGQLLIDSKRDYGTCITVKLPAIKLVAIDQQGQSAAIVSPAFG